MNKTVALSNMPSIYSAYSNVQSVRNSFVVIFNIISVRYTDELLLFAKKVGKRFSIKKYFNSPLKMSIMASEYNNGVPSTDRQHCHRLSIGALPLENGSSNHLPLCSEEWQLSFKHAKLLKSHQRMFDQLQKKFFFI